MFGNDRVKVSETFLEHPMTFDYEVQQDNGKTRLNLEVHDGFSLPMKWMFGFFMKKKFNAEMVLSLSQLKNYCEEKSANSPAV